MTPAGGEQMQVEAMAGVVRQKPAGGSSPDRSQQSKKGRAQQQHVAQPEGNDGAKEKTLQQESDKNRAESESASSSGTLQKPSAWRLPQSRAPRRAAGKGASAPGTSPGAKEMPGQEIRRQHIELSSDSDETPQANQMEVEPAEPADRASASPTATEELSGANLSERPQGISAAPPLPTVPEGGEQGGQDSFSLLSEVGGISANKGSMPQATCSPSKAIQKIVVINPNPGGQAKITQSHLILAAIQVDARACRIDIPEMSMSIMEDQFDKEAMVVSSYIISLPTAAKDMAVEEGELYVPVEDGREVRLEVFDATEEGVKIEKQQPNQAQTAAASGPSYSPKKNQRTRSAQVICIYRMDRQQLGRFYEAGALQHEVDVITDSINAAFSNVDFNYSINFDQPAPMKHPINQLTAYIEYEQAASQDQLARIEWHKMKFVSWSTERRPFICYVPNKILEKHERRACCFRRVSECPGGPISECRFQPARNDPRVGRKREREEAKAAEVEEQLQRMEKKSQEGLCPEYLLGQERAQI